MKIRCQRICTNNIHFEDYCDNIFDEPAERPQILTFTHLIDQPNMPAVTDSFHTEFMRLWNSDSSKHWISAIESADMPRLDEKSNAGDLQRQIQRDVQAIRNSAGAAALSGLWLLAGALEESHSLSQHLHDSTGSMWHGIMHCREGDYGNSKYWYRNVTDAGLLVEIASDLERQFPQLASRFVNSGEFDGAAFVDACRVATDKTDTELCQVAWSQWQSLMIYSIQSD